MTIHQMLFAKSKRNSYIAFAHDNAPGITAYPWSDSGFGTKFANPGIPTNGNGSDVQFSPSGNQIAVSHGGGTGAFSVYPWSSLGFGTRYANPAIPPSPPPAVAAGTGISWSPTGNEISISQTATPFVSVYPWTGSGFGTKFANPATLPPNTTSDITFSPSGNEIAVTNVVSSPFITVYAWSGSGFGTKFADPSTTLPNNSRYVSFSPSGNEIAVAHDDSPFITAYPWSGSGFGTKFANPATLPTGDGYGLAFSPAGTQIAVAHRTEPNLTAYPWSDSGFGTKFADPSTAVIPSPPPESIFNEKFGLSVAFSLDGNQIASGYTRSDTPGASPRLAAYTWSDLGFGTKFAAPATVLTGAGNGVAFTTV